jgi:hypothetical protein
MLDLDPAHGLGIAESISYELLGERLESLARPLASRAFERLDAPRLACRSSAAMEDGADAAFPGIFSSRLDIVSADALASAIAESWRSVFSPTAMRYILRLRPPALDLSLALLIQRQVDARIFGLWFGADPSAEEAGPVAELSLSGPEALVRGLPPWSRLHRRSGHWTGPGTDGALTESIVNLEAAARKLEIELGAPADIEFALPNAGEQPIILQARPITRSDETVRARRLTGLAVDPHDTANDGRLVGGPSIAVIEGLDNDSYDLAFRYDGVVIERLVSRLGHFSILCRELGVPIVSGVPEATLRLVGRPIAIEGATNSVEILARLPAVTLSPWARTSAGPRAVITTTELIVTLLAGSPEVGVDPADAALAIARAYGRSLGARAIEIVASPLSSSDLTALDRLARRYGAAFSAAGLQTRLPRMAVCDHLTLHK